VAAGAHGRIASSMPSLTHRGVGSLLVANHLRDQNTRKRKLSHVVIIVANKVSYTRSEGVLRQQTYPPYEGTKPGTESGKEPIAFTERRPVLIESVFCARTFPRVRHPQRSFEPVIGLKLRPVVCGLLAEVLAKLNILETDDVCDVCGESRRWLMGGNLTLTCTMFYQL
jgi:hypothetical protein